MTKLSLLIYQKILEQKLILAGETVVCAVSGGADSMGMLHLLHELQDKLKIKLVIAHFDHQLRVNSALDAQFVKKVAQKLSLPFVLESKNVKKFSKQKKLSIEEAARDLRYDFFERVALQWKANKVCVAHTKEDQAETILMRILRGTGTGGLGGMREKRTLGKVTLIRPLLSVEKADLKEYLKKNKILWREDSSNKDLTFTRNRIRKTLIPLLKKEFNPSVIEELCRLSEILKADESYFETQTNKLFQKMVVETEEGFRFSKNLFLKLELSLQRYLVRRIFNLLREGSSLSFENTERVLSLIQKAQLGRKIILPGGIQFLIEHNGIKVLKKKTSLKKIYGLLKIPTQKTLSFSRFDIQISLECGQKPFNFRKKSEVLRKYLLSIDQGQSVTWVEYFSADKMQDEIVVRSKKDGDRYRPIGLGGTKKVKQILIDEKIPSSWRDQIPLFVSKGKIFWVGGYRISEDFKVTENTKKVLKVTLSFIPKEKED